MDKPQFIVTASVESGDAVLYVGKKTEAHSYYVKNKDSDYIYVVDSESISKLMKKEEDFTTVVTETAVPEAPVDVTKSPVGEKPLGTSPHGKPPGSSPHGGLH